MVSVTDFKRSSTYTLPRPLDKSNVDYLRCILDLAGEMGAVVAAAYLRDPHPEDKDPHPFEDSLNPEIQGYTTPREVIANHTFDMVPPMLHGYLRKYIVSECSASDATREQVGDELYESVTYLRDVRNSLSHGGATAEDTDRLRGVDLRRFQSVFALRDAYARLLALLSHSPALARQVKERKADLDSLMVTFEHSRMVRRLASDFGAIKDDADVKGLANVVLETVRDTLSSADPETSAALGRLVLTSLGAQLPSCYRVPRMQTLLSSIVAGDGPCGVDRVSSEVLSVIKACPGARFEFYSCVINLAAHCTARQVSAGYPSMLGAACRRVIAGIADNAVTEFGVCMQAREENYFPQLRLSGRARSKGLTAFMEGLGDWRGEATVKTITEEQPSISMAETDNVLEPRPQEHPSVQLSPSKPDVVPVSAPRDPLPGEGVHTFHDGSVYVGMLAAGKPSGIGICNYADGRVYEGGWERGKHSGRGMSTYSDGRTYVGMWKAGKPSGEGVCEYADGRMYKGDWKAGHMSGQGVCAYPNGDVYKGEWKKGKRCGKGTCTHKDGSVSAGEWKGDDMSLGTLTYTNGAVYEGQWKKGKESGRGVLTYADGETMSGEWLDGKPHLVSYSDKEGNCYRGTLDVSTTNGRWVPDGVGEFSFSEGNVYKGDWAQGQMSGHGVMTYGSKNRDQMWALMGKEYVVKYVGEWLMGQRSGQGVMTYYDGTVYDGGWVQDQRSGHGVERHQDGGVYDGYFEN
ncbi:hypothetical protein KIPB_011255 [Kipferlia bialata]|uniref:Uncharacterized protein n=1 Tax=Kipferlia bialata TaxID=797122 RepID=A0A9K3GN70_9EUKA|nr:hypothetical protein KIPB_011255 [Kipferlia bialata]|eukprot:g11255.t1